MRESDPNYKAGPVGISSQTKVTPLLLRMVWDGYPLHYERKYGWGYLKPDDQIKVRYGTSFIFWPTAIQRL